MLFRDTDSNKSGVGVDVFNANLYCNFLSKTTQNTFPEDFCEISSLISKPPIKFNFYSLHAVNRRQVLVLLCSTGCLMSECLNHDWIESLHKGEGPTLFGGIHLFDSPQSVSRNSSAVYSRSLGALGLQ